MGSTQDFEILQVNATGRASFDGSISLISLDVVDSGQYACYVSLSSTAPYVVESSFTNKTTTLNVRGKCSIKINFSSRKNYVKVDCLRSDMNICMQNRYIHM